MSTYTIPGFALQETDNGEILSVAPTVFGLVVPDTVTEFRTFPVGVANDGGTLLGLDVTDNDAFLGGTSIYDVQELDLSVAVIEWAFDGQQGISVVANFFENVASRSNIFLIGGDPLPASAFASPAAAEAFLEGAEIFEPGAGSGFAPGEPIRLPDLPGVTVSQEDFAADNRNDLATDRSYAFGVSDDAFVGGIGSDTVDGGEGNDRIFYDQITGPIVANLTAAQRDGLAPGEVLKSNGTDTLISVENVISSNFSDRIYLPENAGFVFDRAGDDRVQGTTGDTLFVAGSGQDTLIGGADDDALIFLDDGFDGAGAAVRGIELTLTGVGEGTAIDGWGFTDVFSGMRFFDGSALDDLLVGAEGEDGFFGDSGQDTLSGGAGDDELFGGAGDDLIDGGTGRDLMVGGTGADVYRVDDRRDDVVEAVGEGFDRIEATGSVSLRGAEIEAVDLLGSGGFRVTGNRFATEITGNAGDNVLIGGGGGDRLTGGDGTDSFVFTTVDAAGATRIVDFDDADRIALDDRFFGLGDGAIDVRAVTGAQIANAIGSGLVEYDGRSGELSIDTDGRSGPDAFALIAVIEGGGRLGPDEVLLF